MTFSFFICNTNGLRLLISVNLQHYYSYACKISLKLSTLKVHWKLFSTVDFSRTSTIQGSRTTLPINLPLSHTTHKATCSCDRHQKTQEAIQQSMYSACALINLFCVKTLPTLKTVFQEFLAIISI